MARNSFKVDKSLSLRPQTAAPTVDVADGDLYYDSTEEAMRARIKGEWVNIGTGGLSLEEVTTGTSLLKGRHYLALTAGETHTLPTGEEGSQVWISVVEGVDVETSPITITCAGTDTIEGAIETDFEIDLNDTWVLFSWNTNGATTGWWEIDDAITPGMTNVATQSYQLSDTATNIDAGFPYTHGLGDFPQDLELWIEETSGKWTKHDSSTYVLSTSTQLETTGTALADVVGGSTNVKLIASAGPNIATIPDASITQSGVVNISAQSFAGIKTFTDDTVIEGDLTVSGTSTFARQYTTQSSFVEDLSVTDQSLLNINKLTDSIVQNTWSASGDLNTARYGLAGSGTQNAALSFGGYVAAASAVTEKFNGTAWSASGDLNTARRQLAGSGTQNAALSFGGYIATYSAVTEKFNGTAWSASGNLNTARSQLAGSGTQNATLSFGGTTGSVSAVTEKFNGTAWSASGDLNTARRLLAGSGTQNAALSFGGDDGSVLAVTEKFNGTTWSVSSDLNTARRELAGSGTQNAALSFGGSTGSVSAVTEKFNGTSWSASGDLNTARYQLAGSGTQNAALSFGGSTGSNSAVTEKFIGEVLFDVGIRSRNDTSDLNLLNPEYIAIPANSEIQIEVIPKSYFDLGEEYKDLRELNKLQDEGHVWSASGDLNTARYRLAGSGTQNAALSFGGYTGSNSAVTEKFNGTAWSASGDLNTDRYGLAGSGTQNAALSFGGYVAAYSAVTEKFNGTSWSATGDLNTARGYLAGSGTQNAALSFGGYTGSNSAVTEKFNGTAWSASGDLNTARRYLAGLGTQNAALSFGGYIAAVSAVTEKFNGTTWSASGNLNIAMYTLAGSGTQNAALSFGGDTGSVLAVTEKFNGTSWSASGDLNTARGSLAGSGTQNAALSFGGTTGSASAVTEKWNLSQTFVQPVIEIIL